MQLPLAAYSMLDKLTINKTVGNFSDRFSKVSVFEVSGGRNQFAAFVYMCRLNLDLDGASNSYGYDNPANKKHLTPLESWHTGQKGVSNARSQKVGLGNACGDPNDGSKGWKNFLAGNRNFYWAGIKAVTKQQARDHKLQIDDRPELEAGLETYATDHKPKLAPIGSGYFPVVNPDTGYYISGTSLAADGIASAYSPKHYLDSSVVPYAVWANQWDHINSGGKKLRLGDFGLAIENNTGANIGFVYGDSGTPDKVGECSEKLHSTVGPGAGLVTFIAFPGSGSGKMHKGRYVPSPLGPNPDGLIRLKVLTHMMRLHTSAADLAGRLAMGRELSPPAGATNPTVDRARLYNNFMSALSVWTIPG
jgi:hypothetical protein